MGANYSASQRAEAGSIVTVSGSGGGADDAAEPSDPILQRLERLRSVRALSERLAQAARLTRNACSPLAGAAHTVC